MKLGLGLGLGGSGNGPRSNEAMVRIAEGINSWERCRDANGQILLVKKES